MSAWLGDGCVGWVLSQLFYVRAVGVYRPRWRRTIVPLVNKQMAEAVMAAVDRRRKGDLGRDGE